MKLKITIEMDNAAFSDPNGTEAARILRRLAAQLDGDKLRAKDGRLLYDNNGNRVGEAKVMR